MQKKFFSNLQSLQINTIFQEKMLNLRKFTVEVYVIYIYGHGITHWCQLWILLVNIVYLLVKVSNAQYILS